MLHIGNKDINLAVQGAGVLYVGSRKMGPVIGESGEPTTGGTTLHQYDRVNGKATVAGFWTDGNGQRYAVCVVDAAYRSGSVMAWGAYGTDTMLPSYTSSSAALAAGESGTYNTDIILNNYTSTDYPAFNFAKNACTVTLDNQNFESCLPNLVELKMLYDDRTTLDTYDPTLSSYSSRSLTEFSFGGWESTKGAWSSNEYSNYWSWLIYSNGNLGSDNKHNSSFFGVCPIIEIPVDENGTVITN